MLFIYSFIYFSFLQSQAVESVRVGSDGGGGGGGGRCRMYMGQVT